MEDIGEQTAGLPAPASRPRRGGRRRLLFGGTALVLTLTLGTGILLGSTVAASQTQAATAVSGGAPTDQLVLAGQAGAAAHETPTVTPGTPGTPGACDGELTVSRVTNHTITVTRPDGSTSTVYVTSHTRYTENGHAASLSAVKVGSKLYVIGACTNGGRHINATSIEIVGS